MQRSNIKSLQIELVTIIENYYDSLVKELAGLLSTEILPINLQPKNYFHMSYFGSQLLKEDKDGSLRKELDARTDDAPVIGMFMFKKLNADLKASTGKDQKSMDAFCRLYDDEIRPKGIFKVFVESDGPFSYGRRDFTADERLEKIYKLNYFAKLKNIVLTLRDKEINKEHLAKIKEILKESDMRLVDPVTDSTVVLGLKILASAVLLPFTLGYLTWHASTKNNCDIYHSHGYSVKNELFTVLEKLESLDKNPLRFFRSDSISPSSQVEEKKAKDPMFSVH